MELSPLPSPLMLLLILLLPVSHAEEKPRAVLSVSPQRWLTEGDSVTLNCKVTDSSTDWTFSWYREGLYKENKVTYKNSSRGSRGSYTLSPAALNHTGVYSCSAERDGQKAEADHTNSQPLWITGESPPVSLIINPSRTQHFTSHALSLSCEDQRDSTGWTVRRYTESSGESACSHSVWGSVTGSTCEISHVLLSHTGVYWCESKSGETSNPVNITVHDRNVILESPVHPVTEGRPLTLHCLDRNTKPSKLRADFYKDGSVLQKQTTGEMIIHKFSKSDEGFYHCKHPERGESEKSWVSVRRNKSWSPKAMISIKVDKPVYRGETVTLRCEIQGGGDTEWTYSWYKDNKSLYTEGEDRVYTDSTKQEISIRSVNDSDSGNYTCRGQRRDSQCSEMSDAVTLTVSGSGTSNPTVVAVGFGVAVLFIISLILILMRCHRRKKGKQQKTNQTSEQNQSRPGAEDAQSGPLEAGEAAAESSEVTYAPEPKANRKNDANAEPSGSDVTYAELEMKQEKTAKGKTETASVDADIVYSEVKLNN